MGKLTTISTVSECIFNAGYSLRQWKPRGYPDPLLERINCHFMHRLAGCLHSPHSTSWRVGTVTTMARMCSPWRYLLLSERKWWGVGRWVERLLWNSLIALIDQWLKTDEQWVIVRPLWRHWSHSGLITEGGLNASHLQSCVTGPRADMNIQLGNNAVLGGKITATLSLRTHITMAVARPNLWKVLPMSLCLDDCDVNI